MWRWFAGPFQNRRMAVFWLVSALSLASTSAWLAYLEAEKVVEAKGPLALPLGPTPGCDVLDIQGSDAKTPDCAR